MAAELNLPELGFWVDGEFFEKETPEDGHREIALRIIEGSKTYNVEAYRSMGWKVDELSRYSW